MDDITRDEGGDADLSDAPTVASAVYALECCSWDCLSTEIETRETDG